jgi:DNA-directed RNA polymerase specialized sigma24 family protein
VKPRSSRCDRRVKEGDSSALHLLYARYADVVQGYVNSIVRDTHEVEDIDEVEDIAHTVFAADGGDPAL